MTYKLFLDDLRDPADVTWIDIHHDNRAWVVVRTYLEFVSHIEQNGLPDYVTFDHDLADVHYSGDYSKEYTGAECADWLKNYCQENELPLPSYSVHSMNPVGRSRIMSALRVR